MSARVARRLALWVESLRRIPSALGVARLVRVAEGDAPRGVWCAQVELPEGDAADVARELAELLITLAPDPLPARGASFGVYAYPGPDDGAVPLASRFRVAITAEDLGSELAPVSSDAGAIVSRAVAAFDASYSRELARQNISTLETAQRLQAAAADATAAMSSALLEQLRFAQATASEASERARSAEARAEELRRELREARELAEEQAAELRRLVDALEASRVEADAARKDAFAEQRERLFEQVAAAVAGHVAGTQ